MREILKKSWAELKPVWEPLYNGNKNNTPFQDYKFLEYTGKGKPQRKDFLRLIGLRELNLVLYADGEVKAIAPLLVKKRAGVYTVYFRGHFTTANVLDFIYIDWSYEDFEFLMNGISKMLGKVSFFLDRVWEYSSTSCYLQRYLAAGRIETHEAFSIPVPPEYEEWLGGLNKSVRRNMNTRSNKAERENIECSLKVYYGENIDKKLCGSMMFVYADRFLIKNKLRLGPFHSVIRRVLMFILMRDKMTKWLNMSENNFHAVYYMNNEVAAFTSGLVCKDKRVILSRLNIYTKYAKYSPGGFLISSVIKNAIERNKKEGIKVSELDLCQEGSGGMSYKASYGGRIYYKYTFYGNAE